VGAAAARNRKSKEQGKGKDEDKGPKPGATQDWRGEYTADNATRRYKARMKLQEPTTRRHPRPPTRKDRRPTTDYAARYWLEWVLPT